MSYVICEQQRRRSACAGRFVSGLVKNSRRHVLWCRGSYLFLHFRSPRRREKKRSPTPKPTKVHVGHLTRNVNKEHIHEIFSVYGTIKNVELPSDRIHPHTSKGYAYVDYEKPEEAEKAVKHMDGGKKI